MPAGGTPVLEVDIRAAVGSFRLDVAFRMGREIMAILGPSGSGKSLTLGHIAGFRRCGEGRISLSGRVLCDPVAGIHLKPEKRRIGYVLQEPCLFPHLSVQGNLLYGYSGTPGSTGTAAELWHATRSVSDGPHGAASAGSVSDGCLIRPSDLVEVLRLGDLLHRKPATLSGGEKQRVALGRALLSGPEMLLMDEPMSSLDAESRWRLLGYVRDVHAGFGIPILYVTHAVEEAQFLASSVGLLGGGRMVEHGPIDRFRGTGKLFSAAGSKPVVNLLEATVVESCQDKREVLHCVQDDGGGPGGLSEVAVGGKRLRIPRTERPRGARVLISISSTDVIVTREHPAAMSADNIYCGKVRSMFDTRRGVLLLLGSGFDLYVEVTRAATEQLNIREGDELHYIVKADAIRVVGE